MAHDAGDTHKAEFALDVLVRFLIESLAQHKDRDFGLAAGLAQWASLMSIPGDWVPGVNREIRAHCHLAEWKPSVDDEWLKLLVRNVVEPAAGHGSDTQ